MIHVFCGIERWPTFVVVFDGFFYPLRDCFNGIGDVLEEVLVFLGDRIEFCQIQLNYVDWTLQDAKRKIEILGSRGIPVMVMEPLRGEKLTDLGEEKETGDGSLSPATAL